MYWFFIFCCFTYDIFLLLQNENGCTMFIWKDEIGNEKNLASQIENMKKMLDGLMERQNEILWAAVEEMKHASEKRKKIK